MSLLCLLSLKLIITVSQTERDSAKKFSKKMARSPEKLLRKGKIRRYRLIFFRLEPLKTPQPGNFSSPIFCQVMHPSQRFWYQRPKCVIYPPLFCCKSQGLGLCSVISVHIYYLISGVQTSTTSEQSCSSSMLSSSSHSGFTIFVNFGRLLKFNPLSKTSSQQPRHTFTILVFRNWGYVEGSSN